MLLKIILKIILFFTCMLSTFGFFFHKPILRNKLIINSHNFFKDETFHGIWELNSKNKTKLINLCSSGRIEDPTNLNNSLYGIWLTDNDEIQLITLNKKSMVNRLYNGKINSNNLKVKGEISYGSQDPDYSGKFTMVPIFPSLHNISYVKKKEKQVVDKNFIIGKWLLENTYTKNINFINIYDNYTWDNTLNNLGGIWNLYDSDNKIELSTEIRTKGDYIWLLAQKLGTKTKNRLNLPSDILFIGKITRTSKVYYYNEDSPSSENDNSEYIATKINGTIIHSLEDSDTSESFYMTRWWD